MVLFGQKAEVWKVEVVAEFGLEEEFVFELWVEFLMAFELVFLVVTETQAWLAE